MNHEISGLKAVRDSALDEYKCAERAVINLSGALVDAKEKAALLLVAYNRASVNVQKAIEKACK